MRDVPLFFQGNAHSISVLLVSEHRDRVGVFDMRGDAGSRVIRMQLVVCKGMLFWCENAPKQLAN
jgi:hypothetical protein